MNKQIGTGFYAYPCYWKIDGEIKELLSVWKGTEGNYELYIYTEEGLLKPHEDWVFLGEA